MTKQPADKRAKRQTRFPPSSLSWAAIDFKREPPPILFQSFIITILAFFIVITIFGTTQKLSVTILSAGKLTSFIAPVPIRSAARMTVAKVLVKENQVVRKGQPLITSVESMTQKDKVSVSRYMAMLKEVNHKNLLKCPACVGNLREISRLYQSFNLQGDLVSIVSPIQDQVKELVIAMEDGEKVPILTADAVLQIKLAREKLAEIKKRHAEAMLAQEIEALQTQIVVNETAIHDKQEKIVTRISSSQLQIESRMRELENRLVYIGTQLTVAAPFDGTVTAIAVKGDGEYLDIGKDLMYIIPKSSRLIAELEIRNKDVSDVRPNAETVVKIDALPEYQYGSVQGRVIEVVRSAVESDLIGIQSTDRSNVPVRFVARIDLDRQDVGYPGNIAPLVLGMTVRAHIVARSETLFTTIATALFKIQDKVQMGVQ